MNNSKKHKYKFSKVLCFLFLVGILAFGTVITSHAIPSGGGGGLAEDSGMANAHLSDITDEQIIKVLNDNSSFFVNNDIISEAFRSVGWSMVKGIYWVSSKCSTLYKDAFKLLTFSTGSDLNEFLVDLKPYYTAFMSLSIFALGIILVFKHEKKPNILISLLMTMVIATCSLEVLSLLNEFTIGAVNSLTADIAPESTSINANIYDLVYIDKQLGANGLKELNVNSDTQREKYIYKGTNIIDSYNKVSRIDINEVVNPKSSYLSDYAKDILSYKVLSAGKVNGEKESLTKNSEGLTLLTDANGNGFLNSYYYRYKVDYLPIFIMLIAYTVVYISLAYKVVRIILELGMHRVLALLYSADLTGGQKTAKILSTIKNGYIVLLFTAFLIKFYNMMCTLISATFSDQFVKGILILFVSFAVVDGPNLIEKLTGIDAGLSSGVGKVLAGYHAMKGGLALTTAPLKMGFGQYQRSSDIRRSDTHNRMLADAIRGNQETDKTGNNESIDKDNNALNQNGEKARGSNTDTERNKNNFDNTSGQNYSQPLDKVENQTSGEENTNSNLDSLNQGGDTSNELLNSGIQIGQTGYSSAAQMDEDLSNIGDRDYTGSSGIDKKTISFENHIGELFHNESKQKKDAEYKIDSKKNLGE